MGRKGRRRRRRTNLQAGWAIGIPTRYVDRYVSAKGKEREREEGEKKRDSLSSCRSDS